MQELGYLGFGAESVARILAGEGVPEDVIAESAPAAGPLQRRVYDPLERPAAPPEDEAYLRLAQRTQAAESLRTATLSSYGFGFIARLAIASVLAMVALVAALDFFPRLVGPAKVTPTPPQPVPIQLVPPAEKSGKR